MSIGFASKINEDDVFKMNRRLKLIKKCHAKSEVCNNLATEWHDWAWQDVLEQLGHINVLAEQLGANAFKDKWQ